MHTRSEDPGAGPEAPFRLLVVDFTPAGDGTATGELKSALFSGLGELPILQICASGDTLEYTYPNDQPQVMRPACFEDLVNQVDWFAPTLILARPTGDRHILWLLALAFRSRYDIPLLVWIMDDWLSVMPPGVERNAYEASLASVFRQAGSGLSICDEMSDALETRFGVPFTAIANGIEPDGVLSRFSPRQSNPDEPFVLRYAGALAPNMGVDTIEAVAQAVQRLRIDGVDICLEIKTRSFWLETEGSRFTGLEGVRASESAMGRDAYLDWLADADCNLICYNFDEESHRYVRFSLANKLPELLAVGAPVLAIGPADLPTLARIRDLGAGLHLSNPSGEAIERCLRDLVLRRHRLVRLAERGRAVADRHFDLASMRQRFVTALHAAQQDHQLLGDAAPEAAADVMRGFDLTAVPIDLFTLSQPATVVKGAGRIETPPAARERSESVVDTGSDRVPPRPTRETAGQSTELALTEPPPVAAQSLPPAADRAPEVEAGLPLVLERPTTFDRPWLAPLVERAAEFSRSSRQRASETSRVGALKEPSNMPEDAFIIAPNARAEARNGASYQIGEGNTLIIERRGTPPGEHAVIYPELGRPVKGLRVDAASVRGKVDFSAGGEIIVSIKRPGAYDIIFRRPRLLDQISVRCLESMEGRIVLRAIGYLDATPPTESA